MAVCRVAGGDNEVGSEAGKSSMAVAAIAAVAENPTSGITSGKKRSCSFVRFGRCICNANAV